MQFSEVFKNLRKERGLTQDELAKELNISKSTVSMYERSERMPDSEMLVKIARFFNVTVDRLINSVTYNLVIDRVEVLLQRQNKTVTELVDFLGISTKEYNNWKSGRSNAYLEYLVLFSEFFKVPIDYIASRKNVLPTGKGIKIPVLGDVAAGIPTEAITDIEDYEEIPAEWAGEYVALKIKGDSMAPRILAGDVVIIRVQDTVENGEIAVVIVESESTCKRVQKTPDGISLISINPAYDPIFYSNKQMEQLPVRIFGKVVELRGKF